MVVGRLASGLSRIGDGTYGRRSVRRFLRNRLEPAGRSGRAARGPAAATRPTFPRMAYPLPSRAGLAPGVPGPDRPGRSRPFSLCSSSRGAARAAGGRFAQHDRGTARLGADHADPARAAGRGLAGDHVRRRDSAARLERGGGQTDGHGRGDSARGNGHRSRTPPEHDGDPNRVPVQRRLGNPRGRRQLAAGVGPGRPARLSVRSPVRADTRQRCAAPAARVPASSGSAGCGNRRGAGKHQP